MGVVCCTEGFRLQEQQWLHVIKLYKFKINLNNLYILISDTTLYSIPINDLKIADF